MTVISTDEDYDDFIEPAFVMLDVLKPGWEFALDLERFDMMSGEECVLGQLYGSWNKGLYETQGYRHSLTDHRSRTGTYVAFADHTGGPIDRGWRREILRRRQVA